jgi:glycine/D-amino acid oxidase-like deaminating enzyme
MQTNQTTWKQSRNIPTFPKLEKSIETDVAIIGGGMAGLLSAYTLAKAGKKVVVLEKGKLAESVTMYTTAFLTEIIDTDAEDVCRMLGLKKAKIMYGSHMAAIALMQRIVKEEKIDCDFAHISNYIIAEDRGEADDLEDEMDVLKVLTINATLHKDARIGFSHAAALEIKDQACFDPLKFLSGLVPKLTAMGVVIFENTEVEKIEGSAPLVVHAAGKTVTAKFTLTTTYQPFDNPARVFLKKGMYVSYVYELSVPEGKFKDGLYEDMKNPYHYFRVDGKRVILGGEDHRKEIPMDKEKNWAALKEFADKTFGKDGYTIEKKWDGPILESIDGFALIGLTAPNRIVATAFSGNGMTYAGITALMTKEIVESGKSMWDSLYRPKRFPTFTMLRIKMRDYTGEFIRGALRNMLKYNKTIPGNK